MSDTKGIAGHGGNGAPPPQQTVQIQLTRKIEFVNAQVLSGRTPDGNGFLQIIDPGSATLYMIQLSPEDARSIGNALASTVPIASPGDMPGGKT